MMQTPPAAAALDLLQLRQEHVFLRAICDAHPAICHSFYRQQCADTLRRTALFGRLHDQVLHRLAERMERVVFEPGATVAVQGCAWSQGCLVVERGVIEHVFDDESGTRRKLIPVDGVHGFQHFVLDTPAESTAVCSTAVVAYRLRHSDFDEIVASDAASMKCIVGSLCEFVRARQTSVGTPLLEIKSQKHSYLPLALAAALESFYRSAMNNVINGAIGNGSRGPWFPSMYVQLPVRVLYITGLKKIAEVCSAFDTRDRTLPPQLLRLGMAVLPGVLMCPLISVLEATHAHSNPQPLWRRFRHGFAPRLIREVIYGVGINQLSQFCAVVDPGPEHANNCRQRCRRRMRGLRQPSSAQSRNDEAARAAPQLRNDLGAALAQRALPRPGLRARAAARVAGKGIGRPAPSRRAFPHQPYRRILHFHQRRAPQMARARLVRIRSARLMRECETLACDRV